MLHHIKGAQACVSAQLPTAALCGCDSDSKRSKRWEMIWESAALCECAELVCVWEWMCTSVCVYIHTGLTRAVIACYLIIITESETSPGWLNSIQIRWKKKEKWAFASLISFELFTFIYPFSCLSSGTCGAIYKVNVKGLWGTPNGL